MTLSVLRAHACLPTLETCATTTLELSVRKILRNRLFLVQKIIYNILVIFWCLEMCVEETIACFGGVDVSEEECL